MLMTAQDNENAVVKGLSDVLKKIEGSLLPVIQEHITSTEFSSNNDGVDFLAAKNSLLLSYLIDLTFHFSQSSKGGSGSIQRLTEMKVALEKARPLEKKMRYQLDKLLAVGNSASFAMPGEQQDPLSFRPNPDALDDGDGNDEDEGLSSDGSYDGNNDDKDRSDDNMVVDDDLAAARATLKLTGLSKDREANGVYRAPRLAAVPYPLAGAESNNEKQRRLNKKLRTTELAHTLRDMYSEAPEQEDMHGGTEYGKQREAARRLTEMEREKTRFEEDHMIRITTSRKHKKERKKLMRAESSNLGAIADVANITRNVSAAFETKPQHSTAPSGVDLIDGGISRKKRKPGVQGNPLQKALFGVSEGNDTSKRKKKLKRR